MKILVTGANGFVGRHLIEHCREHGHDLIGSDAMDSADVMRVDVSDREAVARMFHQTEPEACVHLAGSAYVPDGWTNPAAMYEVNILGTLNVLEAIRTVAPECRLLFTSSSQIYDALSYQDLNFDESNPGIVNPYSISKLAADMTVWSHARNLGIDAVVARPISHIGPGQSQRFAISSFASQLTAISKGLREPILMVGNLSSTRDFLDVRDVVDAYLRLLEKGHSGESYDVASGKQVRLGDVLELLFEITGVRPNVQTDPKLYRPTDASPTLDVEKLHRDTGWTPKIDLRKTLEDIYASVAI